MYHITISACSRLQTICSYLLWPFAILVGVEVKDAKTVAGMLGWKIFVDEVLCYRDLGEAVNRGELGVSRSCTLTDLLQDVGMFLWKWSVKWVMH